MERDDPYRILFQHNPNPMWVYDRETLAFLAVNEAAIRHHGYSREEYLGMTIKDIHPTEDVPALLDHHARKRAVDPQSEKEPGDAGVWRHRKKDGTLIHVAITWSPVTFRERPAILVQANDVTERHQAEEALRIKTQQLLAISEAMTRFLETEDWYRASARLLDAALNQTHSQYGFIGVVVPGPVLRILAHEGVTWDDRTNRAFYEEALQKYQELGYLEFRNFNNLFGHVLTSGQAVLANDPGTDPRAGGLPPGHPPLRHFLGVPIFRGGEVVGLIGVANRPGGYTGTEQAQLEILTHAAGVLYDSYRRQRREADLEEQLRLAQKMEAVGRLAGGIAHDFNNVLTVINGYCHLLLDRLDRNDPLYRHLEEIRIAGKRAAALTQQLLAFSRRQVLQPKVINLNDILSGMEGMLQQMIGENIHLATTLDPDLGSVQADPGQIEQVIMNLVVNARDVMPLGGRLTVETANVEITETYPRKNPKVIPGSYVMLAVSDTGCGMDAPTQARIFEPFFTTKEEGKGTGLGLSTAYGIVKQSGGYIFVYSEPGQGATFKVYLPRINRAPERSPIRETTPRANPGTGTETVLVVEDEPGVRELVTNTLSQKGYAVLEARHGFEALVIGSHHPGPIHLLLADVVLPQMSGRDLAEQLKPLRPDLKVLFMSGYTENAVVHHGVLDPGLAYIQKPFTGDELALKVRDVLDKEPDRRPD